MRRLTIMPLLLLPALLLQCEPTPTSSPPLTLDTVAISGLPDAPAVAVEPAVRLNPPTTTSTTIPPTTLPTSPGLLPAPQWATWPNWRVTPEGVPYYSGRPSCAPAQAHVIAVAFAVKGASLDTQRWAVYVAGREGGCNYLTVYINAASGDDSHCTFQLNARGNGPLSPSGVVGKLGWTRDTVKASLAACATAAADLWAVCGKGPWIKGDYGCKEPTS